MKNVDYRKANGRRLEGQGLVARVAQEVNGMMLAQAFVVTKGAGFRLRINKYDGVPGSGYVPDGEVVNVDVVGGFVKKSWAN
jgi:hypothetical protein